MPSSADLANQLSIDPAVLSGLPDSDIPTDFSNTAEVWKLARWLARKVDLLIRAKEFQIPNWLLSTGFVVGLLLCMAAFAAVVAYLYFFQTNATSNISANSNFEWGSRLVALRMALLSTGVLAGSSLGFLGICLFLLGIKGAMAVDARGGTMQAKLTNVAPGTLLALCAAGLIGYCATREFHVSYPASYSGKGTILVPGKDSGLRTISEVAVVFTFEAPGTLQKSLETAVHAANVAPSEDARLCELRKVLTLAENVPFLIKDHRAQLVELGLEKSQCVRSLDALNKRLGEINRAGKDIAADPSKVIAELRHSVRELAFELEEIKKNP